MSDTSPVADLIVRVGRSALWAPLSVFVLHILAGGWLGHEPFVDPVMHFLGGAAAAFFFWEAIACARSYLGDFTPLASGLLAFGMASVAAVVWEFGEFLLDWYRGTHLQRDLADTMRDLFLGLSGATAYLVPRGLLSFRRTQGRRG